MADPELFDSLPPEPRTRAAPPRPAGRPEPGAARGRHPRGRSAARDRRRRFRQDAGADPSHRPSDPQRGRIAVRDPGHHLHEQGRGRDEAARGQARRPCRPEDVGVDVPQRVRAHPSARRRQARLSVVLHDLRPGRLGPARRLRDSRPRTRSEEVPTSLGARLDQLGQERGCRGRGVQRPGASDLRAQDRRGVPRVPGSARTGRCHGLRRPVVGHRSLVPRTSRRAGALSTSVQARARRRVPGHQPRAERDGADAGGRAPQRVHRRRPGPVGLLVPVAPTSATSSSSRRRSRTRP